MQLLRISVQLYVVTGRLGTHHRFATTRIITYHHECENNTICNNPLYMRNYDQRLRCGHHLHLTIRHNETLRWCYCCSGYMTKKNQRRYELVPPNTEASWTGQFYYESAMQFVMQPYNCNSLTRHKLACMLCIHARSLPFVMSVNFKGIELIDSDIIKRIVGCNNFIWNGKYCGGCKETPIYYNT